MSKSGFKKLGTADSVIAAHMNGLGAGVNKLEELLDMDTDTQTGYQLTPVADQEDISLQYRIYEADIKNWLEEPEPVIYRNEEEVDPDEYVVYPGHGAIVFHVQQQPGDVVTADFEHIVATSQRLDDMQSKTDQVDGLVTALGELGEQVGDNTEDIEDLNTRVEILENIESLSFPIYAVGSYKNAALIGDGASERNNNSGISLSANSLLVLPMFVPHTMTFNSIGSNLLTPGGNYTNFGIWKDNGAGYPGELVHDSGPIVSATTGLRTSSAEFTLEKGLYWIGFVSNATQAFQGLRSKTLPVIATDWNPARSYVAYRVSHTHTGSEHSLPNPFPSGATMQSTEVNEMFPAAFVRRKE